VQPAVPLVYGAVDERKGVASNCVKSSGSEVRLAYLGHILTENRNYTCVIIACIATRCAPSEMVFDLPSSFLESCPMAVTALNLRSFMAEHEPLPFASEVFWWAPQRFRTICFGACLNLGSIGA